MKSTNKQIIIGVGTVTILIVLGYLAYTIINNRVANHYKKQYEQLIEQVQGNHQVEIDNYQSKIDSIQDVYKTIDDSVNILNEEISILNYKIDSINSEYEDYISNVDTFNANDIIRYLQSRYPEHW